MNHYPVATLGDVCDIAAGGTPSRSVMEYFGGDIPWVKIGDLAQGKVTSTEERITQRGLEGSAAKLFPAGTVLISIFATIGRTAVLGIDAATNQAIAGITPRDARRLDSVYLRHYFDSITATLVKSARGVAQLNINLGILKALPLPLPPLPEQRRIAAILDQADALRAKRREALAQLDSLTQSIFIEMFGESRANPKRWPTRGIVAACELIVDCVNRTAPLAEGATLYKMIRTTNVKSGKVSLDSVRYVDLETFTTWNRRATPRRGDVLLTREAPVGEAGMLTSDDQVFLGQRLMLYRPAAEQITSEFLLASFMSPFLQDQFEQHASGSTVKHLPLPACRAFELRMPPLVLQQTFATRIQTIESLKATQRAALAELDALFAALQHRAFTGAL